MGIICEIFVYPAAAGMLLWCLSLSRLFGNQKLNKEQGSLCINGPRDLILITLEELLRTLCFAKCIYQKRQNWTICPVNLERNISSLIMLKRIRCAFSIRGRYITALVYYEYKSMYFLTTAGVLMECWYSYLPLLCLLIMNY